MGNKFNLKENTSFIQYLDLVNLYGWVMSQPLATGGFKWVVNMSRFTPDEIAKLENKGYLLEVDVRYLEELHDLHNELPFMCEKIKINGVEKLVPNLNNKKYVIHIRASSKTWINPRKGSSSD